MKLITLALWIAMTGAYAQEPIDLAKFALLSSPPEPLKAACMSGWHPTAERLLLPVPIEIKNPKPGKTSLTFYTVICTCDKPH
jgi:hypothetical protein